MAVRVPNPPATPPTQHAPPPPPHTHTHTQCAEYINAAAAASDPLERMKLLVTWSVCGLHKGFETWKKPFNPILGETWQADMSEGGISLFMEQVGARGAGAWLRLSLLF